MIRTDCMQLLRYLSHDDMVEICAKSESEFENGAQVENRFEARPIVQWILFEGTRILDRK